MLYNFTFQPYQIKFKQPLFTHYGQWAIREGIIITLIDEYGNISSGEIAPIPWFGSETLSDALNFCQYLPPYITISDIFSIPDSFPCCQFAFSSAWESLYSPFSLSDLQYCLLLPSGKNVLNTHFSALENQVFKWKIAVNNLDEEINILLQLISQLPPNSQLRLDANGGLTFEQGKIWLEICDQLNQELNSQFDPPQTPIPLTKGGLRGYPPKIEFLEQPLPVDQFDKMLFLSNNYFTPIALDESVANIHQIETVYQAGWRGIFVIKPCIMGYPQKLRTFCNNYPIDVVFSSVFETEIGRKSALKLATDIGSKRALGFGVTDWF